LKHHVAGEQVAGQQEIQDLPAAGLQLDEAKGPAAAQHQNRRASLIWSDGDFARAQGSAMLPIIKRCVR
jgi:hypothetical protein